MAAQSLYRKWRSQTFNELVGQEHVVQTLRNALVEGRVAHAYLFTGPRGVGKTTMARLLAKAVNCEHPDPAQRPCGQCASCVAIAEGRAVDVIEMDAASHTSVEDARELIERVQFRPTSSKYKVYVVDECHMLSTAAFNALLKTLEEPPEHAIFVLATTEVHKVPATILSRCQRFTFTRHGVGAAAAHLRRIAEAEGLSLEPGVPETIARAATGSLRDALGVLEQLASFSSATIGLAEVQGLLGMTAAAEVDALIEALLNGDVGAALRAVHGVADQGADIRQFTRDLVERLRALMLLLAAGDGALADLSEDELVLLESWTGRTDAAQLLHWIKTFSGLDFQLRTTSYGYLPLELAVVEALVAGPEAPRRQEVPLRRQEAGGQEGRRVGGQEGRRAGGQEGRRVGGQEAPVSLRPAAAPAPNPAPARPAPAATLPAQAGSLDALPLAEPTVAPSPLNEPDPLVEPQATPGPLDAPAPADALAAPGPLDAPAPPDAPQTVLDTPVTLAEQAAAPGPTPEPEQPVEPVAPVVPSEPLAAQPETAPTVAPAELPLGLDDTRASHNAALAANADFSVLERVESLWDDVKRDVRPKSPTVQALLHSVRPIDVEGNVIVLLAVSPFHKASLEKPQNRKIVEDVLKKHLGANFGLRCTIESKDEARDLRGQIREARKDELVRAALNIFEAHIVDIEPEE